MSMLTEFLPRMYGISLASYLPVLTLAELQTHQTRSPAISRNFLSARRHNNEAVDNTDTTEEKKKTCDSRTSQPFALLRNTSNSAAVT